MTTSLVEPFPRFADLAGLALDGGYIYVGTANTNPVTEANRINIFFDADLTVGASQPLRTSGGFIVDGSGAPANIYVAGTTDFAVAVHDVNNIPLYTIPSYPARFVASSITFNTVVVGTSVLPDAPQGAFIGSEALPFLNVASIGAQLRNASVYNEEQPSVATDFNVLNQRMMPLLAAKQTSLAGAAAWLNQYNLKTASSSRTADGVYTVVPNIALPSTNVLVMACVNDAIGGAHFILAEVVTVNEIAVRTFDSTGAADDAGFSLIVYGNADVTDNLLPPP